MEDDDSSPEWTPDTTMMISHTNGPRMDMSAYTHLRNLFLHACNQVTHLDGLETLQSLTYLGVANCPRLRSLANLPRQLRRLHIALCRSLSHENINLPDSIMNLSISDASSCVPAGPLPASLLFFTLAGCHMTRPLPVPSARLRRIDIEACVSYDIPLEIPVQYLRMTDILSIFNCMNVVFRIERLFESYPVVECAVGNTVLNEGEPWCLAGVEGRLVYYHSDSRNLVDIDILRTLHPGCVLLRLLILATRRGFTISIYATAILLSACHHVMKFKLN